MLRPASLFGGDAASKMFETQNAVSTRIFSERKSCNIRLLTTLTYICGHVLAVEPFDEL
jgi:hypothetical protein